MARAFADVSELIVLGEKLAGGGAIAEQRARALVRSTLDDTADRMRDEVPRDSDETHDSIEVQLDGDGFGGSVGPTNVDDQGQPVGFFIEHGAGNKDPNPFALRTSLWLEGVMPERAADMVDETFGEIL